ncbi:MAG: alpha/beta hydrolase [Bdellovibrionaceae bacterium]|nr:alpha/beta hydrolase [Pseudobdellovibrionaceae bacterium]MBX3033322.1 alpha/beta hydrolase [Pseudobdellovibrionaceae bacterium]
MSASADWIFIRGLTRGQGHWADFLTMFRERHPGARLECLDLPGNGERFRETSLWRIAGIVEDLRGRSRLIAEGRKPRFFAHSLGAMVAVEWAVRYPQDFERLYLMNTSARNLTGPHRRFNFRNLPKYARLLRARDAYDHERVTLSVIANNAERIRHVLPVLSAYTAAHPVRWSNALRQLWAASRMVFPERAPVPTEIIAAAGDRLVSVENSRILARRWGLTPRIHPTAGHDLAVDDPAWLLEQLF